MPRIQSKKKQDRQQNEDADFIKFLGTAGARFVMIKQLRSSGGLWIRKGTTNVLVDPGPGSIVRCANSRPRLDPTTLDAIILTHKHLDHSNDMNVMIEAMTQGGFKKRGIVFVPADAIGDDPIVFRYVREFADEFKVLTPKATYQVGDFSFTTGPRNPHPVETYGFVCELNNRSIALVGDTALYPELFDHFKADVVILNVVFKEPRDNVKHLSLVHAVEVIEKLKPAQTILTHFGMTMVTANPRILIEELKQKLGTDIIAAYDGMTFVP